MNTQGIVQLLPDFVNGCKALHGLLMYPAALLCYVGFVFRVLPGKSPVEYGMAIFRLTVVVILIGNISEIGDIINGMAMSITNGMGFNIHTNMLGDYQTALATKFSTALKLQAGNNNPWQWLTNGVDMIGFSLLGVSVLIGSMIAACMMFAMLAFQQILMILEISMSPLFLAAIAVPVLVPLATRWATFYVSVALWPLAFRIVDLILKLLLNIVSNPSGNPGITTANVMGGSLFVWIAIAFVAFVGYPLGPFFITKSIVTNGSHGLGVAIPALFGMGLMASRLGGSAVSTGGGAINSMVHSSPSAPYRNYALRPGANP